MPDDAKNDAEQAINQILQRLKAAEDYLLGPDGEPADALAEIEAAGQLAEQLEEPHARYFGAVIAANRGNVLAILSQTKNELEAARDHLRGALDSLRAFRAEGHRLLEQEEAKSSLRQLETAIRVQLSGIEDKMAARAGEDPAERRARRRGFLKNAAAALEADNPYRAFLLGLITFDEAFDLFRETTRAMSRMNLTDATRFIEQASGKAIEAEEVFRGAQGLPQALAAFQPLYGGFRQLIDAQRTYVKTLRAAVLGDVTAQQANDLTEADELLRTGLDEIETSAPMLRRFAGGAGGFDTAGLRESIDQQRQSIRNLRQLVGEGLRPKELVTRSSPRFLIYFALTFVVVLFGARFSGLIPELGGRELLSILLIALVVSATSAFGYHAGYRWLTSLGGALGLGGGGDKGERPAPGGD